VCALRTLPLAPTTHLLPGLAVRGMQVVRGIYLGGFEAAKAGVSAGKYGPDAFKWYLRQVSPEGQGCSGQL
jgi:hypothetical protein